MPNFQLLFGLCLLATSLQLIQNVDALKSRRRRQTSSFKNIHGPTHNTINSNITTINVDYGSNRRNTLRSGINGEDEDIYQPMRFTFITTPIDAIVDAAPLDPILALKRDIILNQVLPTAAEQWSNTLHVDPARQFNIPADICDQNLPYTVITDNDIAIIIDAKDCGSDTLAYAYICGVDSTDRPVLGVVNFCLDTIDLEEDGTILQQEVAEINDVILHEMGHVMGVSASFLTFFRNSTTGLPLTPRPLEKTVAKCVNGGPDQEINIPSTNTLQYKEESVLLANNEEIQRGYYEVVLPTVRQVVRNQFACQSLTGARMENTPTTPSDCIGSHFDERFFFSDLMSAFYDENGAYFSPLILALLQDSGFYKVNFDYARNSPFGLGAGCDFVEEKCIINGAVSSAAKGFFCDELYSSSRRQCGPSLRDKGKCDLFRFNSLVPVPYFANPNMGPNFEHADHCPIVDKFTTFPKVNCNDETATPNFVLEVYGADSKCINLENNGFTSGICLKTVCSESAGNYDFYVGNERYTCEQDFQEIVVTRTQRTFKFECPRLAAMCPDIFCPAMCSGKGICDWDLPKPVCKCFDPNDLSTNCSNKRPSVHPSETPSTSAEPTIYFREQSSETPELPPTMTTLQPADPRIEPSAEPTIIPTLVPSVSSDPTKTPSPSLSLKPSNEPTADPTLSTEPTTKPTTEPSAEASTDPSDFPSETPSTSHGPTNTHSSSPSVTPSISQIPTKIPSSSPSEAPSISQIPTKTPSALPSTSPTTSQSPTRSPYPSSEPTLEPTVIPKAKRPETESETIRINGGMIISPCITSLLLSTIFLLFAFT